MDGQRSARGGRARPALGFGPIDPFCLFAVVPMIVLAVILGMGGLMPVAVVVVVLAALVLAFDSWVHRRG